MMHPQFLLAALFCLLAFVHAWPYPGDQGVPQWGPDDPLVTIVNTSPHDKFYTVETDSGASSKAFQTCLECIKVGAGQTVLFHPGPFNGALTANQHTGTRHEINFLGAWGTTWYDDDMEYGMSDETLGPSDHRKLDDGRDSISGEQDCLAKANAAWVHATTETKQALLDSGYFHGDLNWLTYVTTNAQAPLAVRKWLQMDAQFNAYVGPGSVVNQQSGDYEAMADKHTLFVSTNRMTITIYA